LKAGREAEERISKRLHEEIPRRKDTRINYRNATLDGRNKKKGSIVDVKTKTQ